MKYYFLVRMVDLLKLAPGFCFNLYSKSSDIESLEIDFGIKMFKTSFQSMYHFYLSHSNLRRQWIQCLNTIWYIFLDIKENLTELMCVFWWSNCYAAVVFGKPFIQSGCILYLRLLLLSKICSKIWWISQH